jgi:hypothetical protein
MGLMTRGITPLGHSRVDSFSPPSTVQPYIGPTRIIQACFSRRPGLTGCLIPAYVVHNQILSLSLDILSEPLGYSSNSFASSASLSPFKTAHSLHSTSSARFLAFHYIPSLRSTTSRNTNRLSGAAQRHRRNVDTVAFGRSL